MTVTINHTTLQSAGDSDTAVQMHTHQLSFGDHDFSLLNFPTDANTENVQQSAAVYTTASSQTDHIH